MEHRWKTVGDVIALHYKGGVFSMWVGVPVFVSAIKGSFSTLLCTEPSSSRLISLISMSFQTSICTTTPASPHHLSNIDAYTNETTSTAIILS